MGETLLTRAQSAEEKAAEERLDTDWQRLRVFGEILLEAYLEHEIKASEALEFYHGILEGYSGDELEEGQGERGKSRLFYTLAKQVYSLTPKPKSGIEVRRRGVPTKTLRRVVAGLVIMAVQEGYILERNDRTSERSAYQRVKEILDQYGVTSFTDMTVNSIKNCYTEYKHHFVKDCKRP